MKLDIRTYRMYMDIIRTQYWRKMDRLLKMNMDDLSVAREIHMIDEGLYDIMSAMMDCDWEKARNLILVRGWQQGFESHLWREEEYEFRFATERELPRCIRDVSGFVPDGKESRRQSGNRKKQRRGKRRGGAGRNKKVAR